MERSAAADAPGGAWWHDQGARPGATDARRERPIDRASPADLAMLAMDGGRVPQHIGALLLLDTPRGFDASTAVRVLAGRIRAVPRLRQRLVRVPPGCGRPIWIDDPSFDIGRHVRHLRCPAPGDERALLDLTATVLTDPLPRSRPLWSAAFITGLAGDAVALLIVVHHMLADGIGGMAVLGRLVDRAGDLADGAAGLGPFPRRPPTPGRLAIDAWSARARAPARLGAIWRDARAAIVTTGGLRPVRAADCSLLQPTGPRRRLAVVRADLTAVRTAAHRHGGSVNDAIVYVITAALRRLLAGRGASVDAFAVAVMVAARRSATAADLGNRAEPMVVAVPTTGEPGERIPGIAASIRARRALATGPPITALLGPAFRAAARMGMYRWYLRRQRRLHTLVSNVRGPGRPLSFAGVPIAAVIPAAVAEAGNISVSFVCASYAGTLTITVVADPDRVPDLPALVTGLEAELRALTG